MDSRELIEMYNKILDSYIDGTTSLAKNFYDKQRGKYEYILNKLNRFYFFTSYISDQRLSAKGHDRVLFSIYSKCSLDLLGIYHCLYNGLEVQAGVIFRSLYESYINVSLMLRENAAERIKLYSEFEHVQRWNQVMAHKKLFEKGFEKKLDLTEEDMKIYEENYNKVKNNYHPERPYHWAWQIFKEKLQGRNPNLRVISEYLGPEYEKDYVQTYGTDSLLVHGSSVLHHYYTDNERNVTQNAPKFTDTINASGAITISYAVDTIIPIIEYLKINDCSDIVTFLEFYKHDVLNHDYN